MGSKDIEDQKIPRYAQNGYVKQRTFGNLFKETQHTVW